MSGRGRARYQPIWAEDVAACVIAALRTPSSARQRYELAGPEHAHATTRSSAHVLDSIDRRRPLLHVPTPIVSRTLRLLEAVLGPRAFATWDEAELMECSMLAHCGAGDAERLGVTPRPMRGGLAIPLGAG